MYEDALEFCHFALYIDKDHVKSLYRKAKALAYMFQFEESKFILKSINYEIQFVEELEDQRNGDYYQVIADVDSFMKQDKILNYLDGVEVKMTKDKGRGVFASKNLKRGELLIVEKAIAQSV